jgi:glycerol-3-phosphate acyltransferase PlsY
MPLAAAILIAAWALIVITTRYTSVASMTGAALAAPLAWALGYHWSSVVFVGVAAVAVLALHRANLMRLVRGQELRIDLWRARRA